MADKILKELTLKIWRQKDAKSKGGFETYKIHDISTGSSFLEMLDILNEQLVSENKEPVAFDHDCREGICGTCSLFIDGRAHGPDDDVTTCQLHMRRFEDGAMASEAKYNEYFGFTDSEVDQLYEKYTRNTREIHISREDLKEWYDGYTTKSGERMYNPRFVVLALTNNNIGNYWTSSGP